MTFNNEYRKVFYYVATCIQVCFAQLGGLFRQVSVHGLMTFNNENKIYSTISRKFQSLEKFFMPKTQCGSCLGFHLSKVTNYFYIYDCQRGLIDED